MSRQPRRAGEFALIRRYFAPLAAEAPGAFALSDDAATIAPSPGCELVVTSDALIAGVHFLPDDPPGLIARKALRVNLSDLAAKGATPLGYLLDTVLPRDIDEGWIRRFAAGLKADQRRFAIPLIGGDTTATPGPLTLAITAIGQVREGWMPRRSGAREGDVIHVSGTIGDGALGLMVAREELAGLRARQRAALLARYRLPEPRGALGQALVGLATSSIDVSDGLIADLGHLAEQSGLDGVLETGQVPLSPAARAALAHDGALIERILTGGDDYEILFTAPASSQPMIDDLAQRLAIAITPIGVMRARARRRGRVLVRARGGGRPRAATRGGWTHF